MLESKLFRQARPGAPLVIAVFSFRHDAHLVPDFLENIRPFVHGYVSWDDRNATEELSSEPVRRNRLLTEARKMGAQWILSCDPDERIAANLSRRLPEMLAMGEGILWNFPMLEMFTPYSYRIDGIWGRKQRVLLFPIRAVRKDLTAGLHGSWVKEREGFRVLDAGVNVYHLRMATPERRKLRRELYATADPTRQFQRIGYDYLDDDRDMVLERIPEGRAFKPAFHEDHGLWSPDPGKIGQVVADPAEVRLTFASECLTKQAHGQASLALQGLAETTPEDPDFLPMAAMLAHIARKIPRCRDQASLAQDRSQDTALAVYLRGKAAVRLGDPSCRDDLARLQDLVGPCLLTRDLAADIQRPTEDFTRSDALWRRWVPGLATCREGASVTSAPMSVIVLGFRAQAELAGAVASLRAQDTPCEIVVVNSGGGPIETVLADHLDHIRLITTDLPLFVGAARNIGIDASRGGVIAFLAGDCQALPGWVAGRMREHDLGAAYVSNPVVPEPGASPRAIITINAMYSSRSPTTRVEDVAHFGRSCTRDALALAGYFPTGLRVSEDSALNIQLDLLAPCTWAPDVLTTHDEPAGFWPLMRDSFKRGIRMSAHVPFRHRRDRVSSLGQHWKTLCTRHGLLRWSFEDSAAYSERMKLRTLATVLPLTIAKFLGLRRGLRQQRKADRIADHTQALLAKGGVHAATGHLLADMRKAVALDGQDPAKLMLLGQVLEGLGQDGTEAYRQALAVDPAQPGPVAPILAALVAKGDLALALETAEAAAEQAPLVAEHWFVAARVAAQAGKPALAIAHAQRGLCLSLDDPDMHDRLAAIYQALGMAEAAGFRTDMARRLRERYGKERS